MVRRLSTCAEALGCGLRLGVAQQGDARTPRIMATRQPPAIVRAPTTGARPRDQSRPATTCVGTGGNWHSAAFTWDGEVLVLGWEPGGGSQPECEATDPDVKKSWFLYDAQTGAKLGQFMLPRPQSSTENCTIHNYNIVPTDKRYLLVGGNYQAGISVVDFTDPANAVEVAYADPAPLVLTQLGGDWSTYWYNGRIYESDITRGLIIWNLSRKWEAGARKLPYLNPQTSEFSLSSP
jgi:hypothetical protein